MTHFSQTRRGVVGSFASRAGWFLACIVGVVGIAIFMWSEPAAAQAGSGTITGTVTDAETLSPLEGVQVSIPGSGVGALTGTNGSFRLTGVSAGQVRVEARLIGYRTVRKPVTVSAGGTASVDFQLEQSAVKLEELVVTGTAAASRRKELGNAVGTINASEINDRTPANTVSDLLNGNSSGLVAMSGTGATGAGARIRIRGAASLSMNDQPLIYVDGIRVNNATGDGPKTQGYGSGIVSRLGDFSPDEIESIEIVKGPAAATLYGTEATNGVIQIFTKSGAKGAPTSWNLEISQGARWLHDPEHEIPGIWGPDPSTGEIRSWNMIQRETERGTPVFRTGHDQLYRGNVRGGASTVGYFVSGSYERNEGVYPTNRIWRVNSRANIDFVPSASWDFNVNTGYVKSDSKLPNDIGSGPIFNAMYTFPSLVDTPHRGFLIAPPDMLYQRVQAGQGIDRFTGSVRIQNTPLGWLQHRLTFGLDLTNEDNTVQQPYLGPEAVQFFGPAGARGGRSDASVTTSYLTADYAATATAALSTELTSETSFGVQYYARQTHETSASGDEFAAPGLTTVSSTARRFAGESFVRNVTLGTYLQERVGWKDRRFLTVAARVDNNSAFGQDFNFVVYPKVSGSWVLSEEPFWNVGWMSSLRLRAAFGQTGQQPESFSALRFYLPITTGEGQPGLKPESPGNPDLAPERGSELEAGFDAGLFDERLSLDFTFYNQTVSDVLLQRPLPPSSGFPGSQWVNAGKVRSRGIELSASATPVQTDGFSWDIRAQFSRNWNRVLSVAGAESGATDGGAKYIVLDTELDSPGIEIRHQEGYAPGSWFGWKVISAELDGDGNPINVLCDGGPAVGHKGVPCSDAPFVYLGQSEPKVQGAVTSTVTLFDRLSVSGVLDFKFGQRHGNNDSIVQCQLFRVCRANFYPSEYDPKTIAEYQSNGVSSFAIADAGFAKLRQVSLNYEFPQNWAGKFGARRLSINVTARNLATFTDWPGLDPETYFTNPESTSSIFDKATQTFTPHPMTFMTALRVGF